MAGNAERRTTAPAPIAMGRARTAPLRWFSPMPVAMLKDPSISAEAKVLAGVLLHYDGDKGCYPRIDSLMTDLNVSKHTVIRLLEELERYGFLKREKRGRNNFYHLTPAYVPPARPTDITLTGELAVQNTPPPKPVKRKTLHKRRPDPMLPLAAEKVAPVQPIPLRRSVEVKKQVASVQPIGAGDGNAIGGTGATQNGAGADERVAPVQLGRVPRVQRDPSNRLHGCDPDITKNPISSNNQQQQESAVAESYTDQAAIELALINQAVAHEDAVRWAIDLEGIPLPDILVALKIMRTKPAYRRREIDRPGAYMRTLCKTQVHTDRMLEEHYARASELRRRDDIETTPTAEVTITAHTVPVVDTPAPPTPNIVAEPQPEEEPIPEAPPLSERLANLDEATSQRVDAFARRICTGGPGSAAWQAAIAIALQRERSVPPP